MIIYESTKEHFFNNVKANLISNILKNKFIDLGLSGGSDAEIASWTNSMNFMRNLLDTDKIPNDTYIAIEYKIPFSSKRIDFIITGYDDNQTKNIMVVELKQWTYAKDTDKKDFVLTYVGKGNREVFHPSFQSIQYKYLLSSFNESINSGSIKCYSCAYLHNASKNDNYNLLNIKLYEFVNESPIYFKEDYFELQDKIASLTSRGKGKEILYEVENGKVVPSKKLIDSVANALLGNSDFLLIDSQKYVFENIISRVDENNNIFIINGNPGTGKSVVAINLLSKLLELKKNAIFVAPNAAFRNVLLKKLKSNLKDKKQKMNIDFLFKGSSCFCDEKQDEFDWIIVDEAHRLKDIAYMYKGNNQIMDIIKSSKNVVFFVDEDQVIRSNDIGSNENIIEIAKMYNKKIFTGDDYILETQFRCSGANGYVNALNTTLQINETANFYLNENSEYEFKICDTPQEVEDIIRNKIENGYSNSRMLAGFAWEWKTQKMDINELSMNKDVVIGEWGLPWNYNDPKMLWAIRDDGFMQIGCVHTCQGLEFDYAGVIIGNDLKIDINNNLYCDYDEYKDKAGKKGLKNNPNKLNKLVKNIYKILLTRGQKGTFVYICDPKVREYFKKHIK